MLVITPSWEAVEGHLFRFERAVIDQPFVLLETHPIVVGQQGMAWGVGLHPIQELPLKREGDRKAPAGIFRVGPAFVDADYPLVGPFAMPTLIVDQYWEAIDDPISLYYNQIVDIRTIEGKDWSSSEKMQMVDDDVYRRGLVIKHNTSPAIAGKGSCIFMHRWRAQDRGTGGCTALSPDDLEILLRWLHPDKQPLIVQLPREEYLKKKAAWSLPEL